MRPYYARKDDKVLKLFPTGGSRGREGVLFIFSYKRREKYCTKWKIKRAGYFDGRTFVLGSQRPSVTPIAQITTSSRNLNPFDRRFSPEYMKDPRLCSSPSPGSRLRGVSPSAPATFTYVNFDRANCNILRYSIRYRGHT